MSKVIYNFKTSVSMFIEVKNRVSDFSVGLRRGLVLSGKRIIKERGFENDAIRTKTYDVLKMLTDRNYTFFNIENDYYR